VTVIIGGNRDARPHKACKPRKGSEARGEARWEEERACRPISVFTGYQSGDEGRGWGVRQLRSSRPPTGKGREVEGGGAVIGESVCIYIAH